AEIIDNVNKQTTPGGIILEHSAGPKSIEYTVKSLPALIHTLKAKGYHLVTIPQLLNIPAIKE
ncbi:MAG: polysaccharide deacetylase family protein, partial [Tumebacillaceae bacterium]